MYRGGPLGSFCYWRRIRWFGCWWLPLRRLFCAATVVPLLFSRLPHWFNLPVSPAAVAGSSGFIPTARALSPRALLTTAWTFIMPLLRTLFTSCLYTVFVTFVLVIVPPACRHHTPPDLTRAFYYRIALRRRAAVLPIIVRYYLPRPDAIYSYASYGVILFRSLACLAFLPFVMVYLNEPYTMPFLPPPPLGCWIPRLLRCLLPPPWARTGVVGCL